VGFFRDDAPAVLITRAQQSQADEMRARTRRYAVTMGIRTLCFILAVALPLPVWAKFVLIVGAVVLPWLAVTAANAGPVRKTGEAPSFDPGRPAAAPIEPLRLSGAKIIEGEVVDRPAA